jgi:hypothetical protein
MLRVGWPCKQAVQHVEHPQVSPAGYMPLRLDLEQNLCYWFEGSASCTCQVRHQVGPLQCDRCRACGIQLHVNKAELPVWQCQRERLLQMACRQVGLSAWAAVLLTWSLGKLRLTAPR